MNTPYDHRICYVIDPVWRVLDWESYSQAWATLSQEAAVRGVVGLDLEWTTQEAYEDGAGDAEMNDASMSAPQAVRRARSRRVGPVATVQLCSSSVSFVIKYCDLWHLVKGTEDTHSHWQGDPHAPASTSWPRHRMGEKHNSTAQLDEVLSRIHALLRDPAVVKVGVGIVGDMTKFAADYDGQSIEPCVDLITLSHHLIQRRATDSSSAFTTGITMPSDCDLDVSSVRSLKDVSEVFCNRPLVKDLCIIKSDWGGPHGALTAAQIRYAAGDAEVSFDACLKIVEVAASTNTSIQATLTPAGDAALNLGSVLAPLVITFQNLHEKGAASPVKAVAATRKTKAGSPNKALGPQGASPEAEQVDIGWCKGRSKRYYDNINVYDPSMALVFTVDQSKAEWYVYKKGIAEVIELRESDGGAAEREIAAIQLSFTPDFRKFNDAHIRRNLEYFQQSKSNICVVCGKDDSLVRFAVVPMMYRKYFPSVYMSHNSYDLLLLCTACFARSRSTYDAERIQVVNDFGIPLGHLTPSRLKAFEEKVIAMEGRVCEAGESQVTKPETEEEDDLVSHHLPMALRAKVMREFVELEKHRDRLLTILKYAKALHCHYVTTGVDSRESLTGDRRFVIPEEKVASMQVFVDTHAPVYPFITGEGADSSTKTAVPSEKWPGGSPASPDGIRCLLSPDPSNPGSEPEDDDPSTTVKDGKGRADSEDRFPGLTRLRVVLTEFWLAENPELHAFIPKTVREEERNVLPLVDSHGFFIVRMLMEKYSHHPEKNGEHAVGQFIYRWRRVFLDKLQPAHLPDGWVAEDGILR